MNYTICQPDLDRDRDNIVDLWKRNLPDASEDRYAWLYQSGRATGWLLRAQGGTVVGATGLMDRTMTVFGHGVRAGQAIDLNVDKDHRSMGPALQLQRAVTDTVQRREYDLIYALPVPQAEPVLRRAGYRVLGEMGRWAKPLCCQDYLGGWLHRTLPRKAIAAGINSLLHCTSPETYYRRPPGVRVEVTDHFDRRFDDLWRVARDRFPVVSERTSAYLTWRFRRCPEVRHRAFCLLDPSGQLFAYVVYHRHAGTIRMGDFLCADLRQLDMLLGEFLRLMRRQQAKAVFAFYLGPEAACQTLRRFGFWKRPSPRKALIYVDRERFDSKMARLLDKENWYLTQADVDADS